MRRMLSGIVVLVVPVLLLFAGPAYGTCEYLEEGTGDEAENICEEDTSDEIGIGTSSPQAQLHVSGEASGANLGLRVENTSTTGYSTIHFRDTGAGIYRSGSGATGYFGVNSLMIGTVGNWPFGIITNNTERFVVEGDGDVGIGTTSPGVKLEVNGDGKFTGGDNSVWYGNVAVTIRQDNNHSYISNQQDFVGNGSSANGILYLNGEGGVRLTYGSGGAIGTTGLTLDTSGEVGINDTEPDYELDVNGTIRAQEDLLVTHDLELTNDALISGYVSISGTDAATSTYSLVANHAIKTTAVGLGEAVWASASDMRADDYNYNSNVAIKEMFEPVVPAEVLEGVLGLEVSKWKFKHRELDEDGMHMGVMAQDFHAAFELGTDETTISVVDSIGVLMASVQALAAENDALRQRVAVLEESSQCTASP